MNELTIGQMISADTLYLGLDDSSKNHIVAKLDTTKRTFKSTVDNKPCGWQIAGARLLDYLTKVLESHNVPLHTSSNRIYIWANDGNIYNEYMYLLTNVDGKTRIKYDGRYSKGYHYGGMLLYKLIPVETAVKTTSVADILKKVLHNQVIDDLNTTIESSGYMYHVSIAKVKPKYGLVSLGTNQWTESVKSFLAHM
jgi:hypothetical protein